jgi:hypothetical protein
MHRSGLRMVHSLPFRLSVTLGDEPVKVRADPVGAPPPHMLRALVQVPCAKYAAVRPVACSVTFSRREAICDGASATAAGRASAYAASATMRQAVLKPTLLADGRLDPTPSSARASVPGQGTHA